jgi:hypothetical protein
MIKNTLKIWQKIIGIAFLSMYLMMSCLTLTLAQTVTQPPIIPPAAIENQTRVYIPYNSSGQSTKGYMENNLLPGIASTIIGITGGLALLFTVVSGIMLLVSYGNPDMTGKATKTLTYSLIGVVIAGLSYAIVKVIASINP